MRCEVGGVDHFRSRFLQCVDATVQERIQRRVVLEKLARDAQARSPQAFGIKGAGIIRGLPLRRRAVPGPGDQRRP